jgi:protein ImuB
VAAVGQGGLALPPATGPRLLALHLPALPLQRLARGIEGNPASGRPVAVVAEGRVVVCDAAARDAGVRPGDTQAQAMAACGALRTVPHAPAADLQALRGLAEALLAIGPAVEVVAPDALLLDAGAAHLLGGGTSVGRGTAEAERRLIAEARALAAGLGYAVRAAVASGRGPALALARHGAEASACVAPGREAQALAPLPLEALGLGPAVAERLAGVGVRSVGELARLPAEGLALRFGPAGAAAARLARGDDPSLLTPYLPETLPEEAIELEGVAESAEPVLFVLGRLAERVAARLGGRGLGASRLKLTLKLDPRGEERLLVPLARPSSAPERWLPTLRERLLALRLPGAVTGVRLTAVEVAACPAAQLAFGDRPEVAAALETVLARLGGRLGDGAVLAAEPVDRHRPEAAWRTAPFRPARGGAGGSWGEGAGVAADGIEARRARPSPRQAREEASSAGVLQPYAEQQATSRCCPASGRSGCRGQASFADPARPTRLLAEPLPVVATGEGGRVSALRLEGRGHAVLSFEGPERLSGEWWSTPFDRDYYRARVEGLGECWLYRDGADGRLWLHGFFD